MSKDIIEVLETIINVETAFCRIFSVCAISVESVRPLYGPVAGGTRVTITGRVLNVSSIRDVYIGPHRLNPHSFRLSIITILIFMLSPHDSVGEDTVFLGYPSAALVRSSVRSSVRILLP